ncbi:MAG: amino acid adenylation domain-containing protein [Caldilineaceae bacterium]|nr:amino acid adenylation domain-containing protein [Caldilineaceae bacterium]
MAYLMYTSGSTGEPKGMIHTHFSGLSYAKMAAEVYGLHSEDRLSSFPPLHFDQSIFDYFSGPLAGATTVIIPEEHMLLPASLSQLMADERLSVWYSVPFALIQLAIRGALEERDLTSLRWVLYGGEPFPPKHLAALMALWPHARFSNVYGPAEVNQCTYYHVPQLGDQHDEAIPIGQIWPNAEGLVVDENDQPVAAGEVGELLVRSPTMMQGYWRRPDLNAEAFFRRASPGGHSEIFYRTGDLVQLPADGAYRFLGRKDRQIKTRGFRVELDEVESVLSAHPSVEESAVFAVSDQDHSVQIQAAVLVRADMTLTVAELVRHAQAHLPRYAVPARIEILTGFPRTSTDKIDRKALQKQLQGNGIEIEAAHESRRQWSNDGD